jgi:hypothetical protein
MRSTQTGQNSIAPESSLPQVGQVRWGSVLMVLTALRSRSEPKKTPCSTEWCESGQHGPWQTVVPFHKLVCSIICAASSNRNEKHQTHRDIRRHDIVNRTRICRLGLRAGLVNEMPTKETINRSRHHSGQVTPRFLGLSKPSCSGNPAVDTLNERAPDRGLLLGVIHNISPRFLI